MKKEKFRGRLDLRISEESYAFLKEKKIETGKSISYLVDQMVKRSMDKPTQFLGTEVEQTLEKIERELRRLRTISNANNEMLKINQKISNYNLLVNGYRDSLDFMGGVDHPVMEQAKTETDHELTQQFREKLKRERISEY